MKKKWSYHIGWNTHWLQGCEGSSYTKKIREYNKKIPIFVGGQAFTSGSKAKFDGVVLTDLSLSQISKVVRPKKKR